MFACDYFLPAFFLANYPQFTTQFGLIGAMITFFGGLFSSISGGLLADKLIKKHPRAYANICMWGSILGWPFFTLSVLLTNNFYLAMAGTAGKYFIGEGWWSPNITMIQKSTPTNKFGNIISAYQFYKVLSGCASTVIFGALVNKFGSGPAVVGKLLACFGTVGYLGSALAWWKAGNHFAK